MAEAAEGQEFTRTRIPKKGELIGVVTGRSGGARFIVQCEDKKERVCRVPGKIKHTVWVKEGDVVIIAPWPIEGEKRGDIVWRYMRTNLDWLRRQGYLKNLPI